MSSRHGYDFGLTSELALSVKAEHDLHVGGEAVCLLARNEPLQRFSTTCGAPTVEIEAGAMCNAVNLFYCEEYVQDTVFDEIPLPVVDSPRVGVCSYARASARQTGRLSSALTPLRRSDWR